jgi:hypothetical protein
MEVLEPLRTGHWLLQGIAARSAKPISYWETRATAPAPRHSWRPGTGTKALAVIAALAAFVGWQFHRDTSRFNALSPAEQYEEPCKQDW